LARPARSRRSSAFWRFAIKIAPPTINLDNPSVETAIDLVPLAARKREINVALSNSFGFGGTNASVIVQRVTN
jgi:3-oxoacyl-[acyl-carrier-protein] synthase II